MSFAALGADYLKERVEESTTSGLRTSESEWYCGRVTAGRERLLERALHRFDIETYLPVYSRTVGRRQYDWHSGRDRQKLYSREFPLFAGYVFVLLDDYGWVRSRSIEVGRKPEWLDFGSGPVKISSELIEELRAREQNGLVRLDQEEYREGDELEITVGVMSGMRGILSSDPDRRMVTLMVLAETYALQSETVAHKVCVARENTRRTLAH